MYINVILVKLFKQETDKEKVAYYLSLKCVTRHLLAFLNLTLVQFEEKYLYELN